MAFFKISQISKHFSAMLIKITCLALTHVDQEDVHVIEIEGYKLLYMFRNNKTDDSGGILIALKDRIRNIVSCPN